MLITVGRQEGYSPDDVLPFVGDYMRFPCNFRERWCVPRKKLIRL